MHRFCVQQGELVCLDYMCNKKNLCASIICATRRIDVHKFYLQQELIWIDYTFNKKSRIDAHVPKKALVRMNPGGPFKRPGFFGF